jgi:RNA polymerase sigma factor (sigma-70 family)
MTMLYHNKPYLDAVRRERRSAAERHRAVVEHDVDRLVAAAARGDDGAWASLVERFTTRVRAVARRHRLSPDDVEDVVQTAWLRLVEHIDELRNPAAVGAWLDVTARHESLRLLRERERERPEPAAALAQPVAPPVDEARLAASERRASLRVALDRLTPRQRLLIGLLVCEPEMTYAEISQAHEIPVGSIGPTWRRGLERLRCDDRLLHSLSDYVEPAGVS